MSLAVKVVMFKGCGVRTGGSSGGEFGAAVDKKGRAQVRRRTETGTMMG